MTASSGSTGVAPARTRRRLASSASASLARASSIAMTAPFIPPRPISAMITTRPRVSGGRRARAAASALTAARVVGVTFLPTLRDRDVQVAQRDVVVGVPVEPLVEDRHVDGVRRAGRAARGVGELAPRPGRSSLTPRRTSRSRPRSAACAAPAGRARPAACSSWSRRPTPTDSRAHDSVEPVGRVERGDQRGVARDDRVATRAGRRPACRRTARRRAQRRIAAVRAIDVGEQRVALGDGRRR